MREWSKIFNDPSSRFRNYLESFFGGNKVLKVNKVNNEMRYLDSIATFPFQTLPGKIKINSQTDIGSMSVMNRLMSDGGQIQNHFGGGVGGMRRRQARMSTNGDDSESSESSLPGRVTPTLFYFTILSLNLFLNQGSQ